jgi:hypothetical protein
MSLLLPPRLIQGGLPAFIMYFSFRSIGEPSIQMPAFFRQRENHRHSLDSPDGAKAMRFIGQSAPMRGSVFVQK